MGTTSEKVKIIEKKLVKIWKDIDELKYSLLMLW